MLLKYIKNRRAFTLIELMLSISLFSIIILISFSIVNYVPKLTKVQSTQFSERTYVRSALADITRTIQSATEITGDSPIVFTFEGNDVSYKFSAAEGKVLKVVGSESHTLMESIEGFELTSVDNEKFDVTIKTREEGKTYSFKVSSRSTAKASTDFPISTIDPVQSEFDKNELNTAKHTDITVKLDLNGNIFVGLQDGSGGLDSGSDYTYDEAAGEIVISKEYLKKQSNGELEIVFDVSSGADPVLKVNITDTSPNIKVVGNANEDEIARMNYPNNLDIDGYDSGWILKITSGTVKSGVTEANLKFDGLPEGLSASAERLEEGNRIKLTLSGRAFVPVTSTVEIGIIIKDSAVEEPGAVDSDTVTVYLLPGTGYPEPGQSIVYTGYFALGKDITINGDVIVGSGIIDELDFIPHLMFQGITINGYIYVDTSLVAGQDLTIGSESRKVKVFVNGSAYFDKRSNICGDIYYRDYFYESKNDPVYVSGIKKKGSVDIPNITMPALKSDDWYEKNGYTIINNPLQTVELEDNGKYFFDCPIYTFSEEIEGIDNVTIVSKGSVVFNKKFVGTGIIAAPQGIIAFTKASNFTGALVAQTTALLEHCTFTYRKYDELPFN